MVGRRNHLSPSGFRPLTRIYLLLTRGLEFRVDPVMCRFRPLTRIYLLLTFDRMHVCSTSYQFQTVDTDLSSADPYVADEITDDYIVFQTVDTDLSSADKFVISSLSNLSIKFQTVDTDLSSADPLANN